MQKPNARPEIHPRHSANHARHAGKMTYIYMCLVGLQFSEGISQSKATGRVVFSKKKSYHVLLHIIIIKKKPEMPLKLNGHAINQKKIHDPNPIMTSSPSKGLMYGG